MMVVFASTKKSYNFESLGTVKSPQKVRKLNFGPLYLLFNKTNSYCILYFFIIHLSPLPRGIACKDRAFMEGAALVKVRVASQFHLPKWKMDGI